MTKPAARAVADVTEGTILATVDIAVPPQRVFTAITDGDEIVKWWGSSDLYRTTSWVSDLRVGGKWRAEGMGRDGTPFLVEGEFLEVDPPRRLVHTWEPQWDGGASTIVTYTLAPTESGTRLTLRHEGFRGRPDSCRDHAIGWERVLDWLAGLVSPPAAARERYYFVRLIAPRPDFAMTLTPEERAVMSAHGAYWRARMAEGQVVVFGPVDDPAGPWGLGVLRADSPEELAAFQSSDPAILSGRGFSYEQLPMLSAVWREP